MDRPALLRPLALRDFRLVWLGQAVSMLGDQFHMIALAWLVLDPVSYTHLTLPTNREV